MEYSNCKNENLVLLMLRPAARRVLPIAIPNLTYDVACSIPGSSTAESAGRGIQASASFLFHRRLITHAQVIDQRFGSPRGEQSRMGPAHAGRPAASPAGDGDGDLAIEAKHSFRAFH
jgi:hypothetical protein